MATATAKTSALPATAKAAQEVHQLREEAQRLAAELKAAKEAFLKAQEELKAARKALEEAMNDQSLTDGQLEALEERVGKAVTTMAEKNAALDTVLGNAAALDADQQTLIGQLTAILQPGHAPSAAVQAQPAAAPFPTPASTPTRNFGAAPSAAAPHAPQASFMPAARQALNVPAFGAQPAAARAPAAMGTPPVRQTAAAAPTRADRFAAMQAKMDAVTAEVEQTAQRLAAMEGRMEQTIDKLSSIEEMLKGIVKAAEAQAPGQAAEVAEKALEQAEEAIEQAEKVEQEAAEAEVSPAPVQQAESFTHASLGVSEIKPGTAPFGQGRGFDRPTSMAGGEPLQAPVLAIAPTGAHQVSPLEPAPELGTLAIEPADQRRDARQPVITEQEQPRGGFVARVKAFFGTSIVGQPDKQEQSAGEAPAARQPKAANPADVARRFAPGRRDEAPEERESLYAAYGRPAAALAAGAASLVTAGHILFGGDVSTAKQVASVDADPKTPVAKADTGTLNPADKALAARMDTSGYKPAKTYTAAELEQARAEFERVGEGHTVNGAEEAHAAMDDASAGKKLSERIRFEAPHAKHGAADAERVTTGSLAPNANQKRELEQAQAFTLRDAAAPAQAAEPKVEIVGSVKRYDAFGEEIERN